MGVSNVGAFAGSEEEDRDEVAGEGRGWIAGDFFGKLGDRVPGDPPIVCV